MGYPLEKAVILRKELFCFLDDKEIKKELKKEALKENCDYKDGNFREWFLFEKTFSEGQHLIDIFLLKNLPNEDVEILLNWKKYVFSIFKIKKENPDSWVFLNMLNNEKYIVKKEPAQANFKLGDYMATRLLPFNKEYIFANNDNYIVLKTSSNDDIYRMVALFELEFPNLAFIDNNNKMETSYRIQSLEHDDFFEFFGSDEIILEGKEIKEKLQEFYHYRYFQKKDKDSGKTIAKIFREKFSTYPEIPSVEIPDYITNLDEVGIIYDRLEGLNFLPWYGIFKEIFRRDDFKSIIGYKECVLEYLKSETISVLPFRRVLIEFPNNTAEVLKDVLERKRVSIPEDWEKIMNKYKKNIMSEALKPSIISMTDKTKALLRTKRIEEYTDLHLSKGYNSYKDIRVLFDSKK